MADETTAQAPVDSLSETDVVSALENQFSGTPKQPPKEAPQPEVESDVPEQPDGEPTETDLESEEAPHQEAASEDTFEIVHNGQQVKLTRAEIIANAQKGFDYDRKTQAVAEKFREAEQRLQRVQAIEQVMPVLQQDLATVKALEAQLQKYSQVDWVRLATDDPLEYPKHRAQYDQLVNAYQGANYQLHQRAQAVSAERQHIAAQRLQEQSQRLPEIIPQWANREVATKEQREILGLLEKRGVPKSVIAALDAGEVEGAAELISLARDALLYNRLKTLKTEKSKQLRTAPPVVKPGTAQPDKGRADRDAVNAIRKLGKTGNHSAQEKIMEGLLGKAFKL